MSKIGRGKSITIASITIAMHIVWTKEKINNELDFLYPVLGAER